MDSSGPERQMTSPVFIVLLFQQTVPRTSFHISSVEIATTFQVVRRASPPQLQISCAAYEETPSPVSRPTPKNAASECAARCFCAKHGRASTVLQAWLVLLFFSPCLVQCHKCARLLRTRLLWPICKHTHRTVFSQSTLQSPSM